MHSNFLYAYLKYVVLNSAHKRHSRAEANFQFFMKDYDGRQFFFRCIDFHGLIVHHIVMCTKKVSRVIFYFMTTLIIFYTIGKTSTYCILPYRYFKISIFLVHPFFFLKAIIISSFEWFNPNLLKRHVHFI